MRVRPHVHPGGIHAGELLAPDAELTRRITGYRANALDRALSPPSAPGATRRGVA
ncbi:hypothetical protein [Streptomyces sp. NBC_00572]|uniref:hypothetical protein n=1 Tax=Streptomyces sp. NBC_00572 TaxID=2903664 RepID=UPI00224C8C03|nr:hypothetical protein [Streptomyces sp. NBC_00572]MCX4986285.1 hypothetical protein [Streptomyces sp. NBC_00572]